MRLSFHGDWDQIWSKWEVQYHPMHWIPAEGKNVKFKPRTSTGASAVSSRSTKLFSSSISLWNINHINHHIYYYILYAMYGAEESAISSRSAKFFHLVHISGIYIAVIRHSCITVQRFCFCGKFQCCFLF